jgi:sugar phosphate isomerase/epimerase
MTADPWSLEEAVRKCARSGVRQIGVWRHKLDGDAKKASAMIRGAGLRVSSLCRGGWFSAGTAEERRKRMADNRVAIEEAAVLGAPVLVIVSGPADGQTSERCAGHGARWPARSAAGRGEGRRHSGHRAAASHVRGGALGRRHSKQANDMADQLASPAAGVVVDAFHVWWDPEVMHEIARARGKIVGFHVSDWPVPLPGILMGRAMMGDGVIELRHLRQAVDAAGYSGPIEVEIFNDEIWKSADDRLIERIQQRFLEHV